MALTNAHIVAGSQKVEVALPGRTLEQASVLAFDPERDLALLRVDSTIAPLQLESPLAGQLAGVIGHPGGGPLRTAPIRLVERVTAHARDLHDSVDTTRKVWFAAAKLQTGDSGAPVIDTNGAVVAVIFAVAPPNASDYERTAYALDRSEMAGFMAEVRAFGDRTVVNTGKCLG
jgi:S1-C subfamily serine protease